MSQAEVVIRIESLSKTFSVKSRKVDTLRQRTANFLRGIRNSSSLVKALDDVSFEVYKGEFLGIVGHNGSGKSTLLKLILGAFPPDKGSTIEVNGKIIRLALGMGFDKELTARDNIYVNGAVLGLSFKQLGAKFIKIIDFAELHEYVDVPIKFYSNGMRNRLAFAIAMHAEADIYLMDEFFGGVGDVTYMKHSVETFHERILQGKTIVHVTHNLKTLADNADRVIWLDKGKIKMIGTAEEVLPIYREEGLTKERQKNAAGIIETPGTKRKNKSKP